MKSFWFSLFFHVIVVSNTLGQQTNSVENLILKNDTFSIEIPSKLLRVGYYNQTPFISGDEDPEGLTLKLWNFIAEDLSLNYELVKYPDYESLKKSIETNGVDIGINPMTVKATDYSNLDFTQPVIISNLAIAVPKEDQGLILTLFSKIFSWEFLVGVLIMGAVILGFGFLAWLFERKANRKQFPNNRKGLWDSFWWSAVTMTTVGYGDKAPKTIGGRLVAVTWMFTAVIIVASYTATISSSLTLDNLSLDINSLDDLRSKRVLVDENSGAKYYLDELKISTVPIKDAKQALPLVIEKKADAYIGDEVLIKYLIELQNYQDDLMVAPGKFFKQYYAFALPRNSALLRPINLALIETLNSEKWSAEKSRHLLE